MTVYLGCGAGESSDEMFLIRGDVQGRGQFADVEQVLGQSSAERQDPGVETCLTWRKIKQQQKKSNSHHRKQHRGKRTPAGYYLD